MKSAFPFFMLAQLKQTNKQTKYIQPEEPNNSKEDSYPVNSAQQVKMGSSHASFFVVTLEEDSWNQHYVSL